MLGPDAFAQQQRLPARSLSAEDVDSLMTEVERGQQVAGHFPSPGSLERARRVLVGELTTAEALAEIDARLR